MPEQTTAADQPATPECDRARKVKDQTQAAGEFLEWASSQGIFLGHYVEEDYGRFNPVHESVETLLARWMGIDLAKVEQEKRAILEWIRERG